MNRNRFFIIIISLLFCHHIVFSQEKDCVSVRQETQVLSKGAKSIFRCDIYYDREQDAVVTHHYYPAEFIKMSNRLGELKIYFPGSNTVSLIQDESFATTNELLYYFINNKVSDMGLSKEGFKLINTSREDDMVITNWQPPNSSLGIKQIKLVFKESLPIYAEYQGLDGNTRKKIYYSQYTNFNTFRMPLRITEISFESKNDSTIQLSVFSDVHTDNFPDKTYFNFKIPDDAKLVK